MVSTASRPRTAHAHALTVDALGDHEAVGLAEAIRHRRVSIPDVVEAAIARTMRVASELNAVYDVVLTPTVAQATLRRPA